MSEPMTIVGELWTFAADKAGIWLLDSQPWETDIIMADWDIHAESESLLRQHGISKDDAIKIHSTGAAVPCLVRGSWQESAPPELEWTSWRPRRTSVILTYASVVRPGRFVREAWPSACPVTTALMNAEGRPRTHAANEAPVPRDLDVMWHILAHLKDLMGKNAESAAVMGDQWPQHLARIEPELATLYDRRHAA
jgi:hypothetical protein